MKICGTESQVRIAKRDYGLFKYCSDECRILGLNKFQGREKRRGSEKRYLEAKGYVRVIDWSTGKRRFIMEHRLVMERMIGRRLRPEERVHRINGDRADNRPENLRLYVDHSEHMRVEHPQLAATMNSARKRA
jgi:HNH endonuclease